MPKRYILAFDLFRRRALAMICLHHCCRRARRSTLIFGAVIGLLWLSTDPADLGAGRASCSAPRWLTMLLGIAFFSHQVGGFLGVWLGGVLYRDAPAPTT